MAKPACSLVVVAVAFFLLCPGAEAANLRLVQAVTLAEWVLGPVPRPERRVVVGIPTISVYGHGSSLQEAIEYLGEFLTMLHVEIRSGEWVAAAELQGIGRWLKNRITPETSPA